MIIPLKVFLGFPPFKITSFHLICFYNHSPIFQMNKPRQAPVIVSSHLIRCVIPIPTFYQIIPFWISSLFHASMLTYFSIFVYTSISTSLPNIHSHRVSIAS